MIRMPKGCAAPALSHLLKCKFICNDNRWDERCTKDAFGILIIQMRLRCFWRPNPNEGKNGIF